MSGMGLSVDTVHAWAAAGESATRAVKKSSAENDRACRTLCAFANDQGARVLLGVTPAGKVVGQTVTDRRLEELAQEFLGFEPLVFPLVERAPIDRGAADHREHVASCGSVAHARLHPRYPAVQTHLWRVANESR